MNAFNTLDGMPTLHAMIGTRRDEVLALLSKPMSVVDLCRATDLTKPAIGYHLQILTAPGPDGSPKKAHICGWLRPNSGPYAAVYQAGDLPDAPKPLITPRTIVRSATRKQHTAAIDAAILALILYRPLSRAQLAEASGMKKGVVACAVERLHGKPRQIYIAEYQNSGQGQGKRPVPRYRAGDAPDALYLPPAPREKESDRAEKERRAAQLVEAATAKPNSWLGALGL